MPLDTGLIDEWLFENSLSNNILGRSSLVEYFPYPQGMMFSAFDMVIKVENDPLSTSGNKEERMNLYLQNADPKNPIPSSTMNLFINNFYDIADKNLTAYINGAGTSLNSGGVRSRGYIPGTGTMNLFLPNTDPVQMNTNTSLFIAGPITAASSVPLYISGGFDNMTGQITFWTSGIAQQQQATNLFIAGY